MDNQKVKKGQKLYTMYATGAERLKLGIIAAKENVVFQVS